MKLNIEEIPILVFELMSKQPFDALEKEMQNEVLKCLTNEEYDKLHHTHCSIAKTIQTNPSATSRKSELLNIFEETHQNRRPMLSLPSAMIWKAASVLFLLSTLWFAIVSKKSQNELGAQIVEKVDTLVREIPSIVYQTVRDTIYLKAAEEQIPRTALAKIHRSNKKRTNLSSQTMSEEDAVSNPPVSVDLHILTLSSIDKISNTSKRNSMNDDSLERNFKFVSL